MLIQNNYHLYQNGLNNKFATKANTSSYSSNVLQNTQDQVSFQGHKKVAGTAKKVAIGAIIVTGALIAADVIFNKGKNLKTLQKKFVNLFSKKAQPKKVIHSMPQNGSKIISDASVPNAKVVHSVPSNKPKIISDASVPSAKVKPSAIADGVESRIKIKETKSPKGKLLSKEIFEYDEFGNISKYTVESTQRGTSATYNYATGEYTVKGAKVKVKNAAGDVVVETRDITYTVEKINPEEINFTQRSMGENYKDIAESLRKNGWQGQPVDVIKTSDGKYISMDNRRIAAAREAGVDVHVVIHEIDEPLTMGKCTQYRIKSTETSDAFEPLTWGEAIYNRLFQNGLITPGGSVDLVAAHNVPSIIPDAFLDSRKLDLFNLYFLGQKPYSPVYF